MVLVVLVGEPEAFVGSGNGQENSALQSQPGLPVLILSHATSGLGQARWGRECGKGKAGGKTEVVHDTYPRETNVGIYVMNRVLGTYPDFVILCLVLQILIKFLLGVEFNAIHFKLLSNLEAGGEAWWPSVRIERGLCVHVHACSNVCILKPEG